MARPSHVDFMHRAIELAQQGKGRTSPNPIVGAVVASKGRILAEGFHRQAGTDHAEIVALKKLPAAKAQDATLYVTLEPCCQFGKTPPCVPRIVEKGIHRVVVGCRDPNPNVNGKGIHWLKEAGIDVIEDVLHDECHQLILPFEKYITTKLPYVTLKVALSLDGKIAMPNGESRWITNSQSRQYVHELRDEVDAILIGGGTFRKDDPQLTVRNGRGRNYRQPAAVIVDTMLEFPLKRKLFKQRDRKIIFATTWRSPQEQRRDLIKMGAEVWLLDADLTGRVELKTLLKNLAEKGITHVMVEGGGEIFSSFVAQGFADRVVVQIAPKLLGGQATNWLPELAIRNLEDALELEKISVKTLGDDILVEGRLKNVHRDY